MADKTYKVGEAVEVVYQALNAKTAATVNMEVYDEGHVIVVGGPIVMTELGSSGRYYAPFTPDAEGEWSVQIQESDGSGKVTKAFSVGSHNIKDVGATVDTIANDTTDLGTNLGITEGKVDTVDGKIDAADAKIVTVDGKIDTVSGKADTTHTKIDACDAKVTNLDGDIVSLDSSIDTLGSKVDGLSSPPMVG